MRSNFLQFQRWNSLNLKDCLGLDPVDRLYYTHTVSVINGMSQCTDADLMNLAVAFLDTAGGTVGANDYKVQAQASPNNTILVNTGRAYVPNLTSPITNMYSTYLNATQNVTIGANSSGFNRTDYICLGINTSVSPDAGADNVAILVDAQGSTPGDNSAPVPTQTQINTALGGAYPYIILAKIAVPNGFISINGTGSTLITDLRNSATFTNRLIQFPVAYGLYDNGNTPGATPTIDWSNGDRQKITLNANATPSYVNMRVGQILTLEILENGTGGFSWAFPSGTVWPFQSAASITTTANAINVCVVEYDGTNFLTQLAPNFG